MVVTSSAQEGYLSARVTTMAKSAKLILLFLAALFTTGQAQESALPALTPMAQPAREYGLLGLKYAAPDMVAWLIAPANHAEPEEIVQSRQAAVLPPSPRGGATTPRTAGPLSLPAGID